MNRMWIIPAALLCAAGIASSQPELPEGAGKQQVEQLCTACHSLQPIVTSRHTKAEWRAEVDNMVGLGAQGTDEDFNAVVEYLSRNYGKGLGWPAYAAGAALAVVILLLSRFLLARRRRPLTTSCPDTSPSAMAQRTP